jgi:hypothetical protein
MTRIVPPQLFLYDPEGESLKAGLPDLPPVGVGIEAVISHGDLAFVGDMGSHPGDELQVVHRLGLFGLFPVLVAELACLFIERESLQGKQRPDHVF